MLKKYQFLLVPILLILFIAIALNELTHFYFSWYDPVYAYLMNGLTFALGSCDIGHTDHPGTPLQLFCALIIRIVHFFRGGESIAVDVLSNPELYIFIISWVLVAINCIALIFLGIGSYKITRNLHVSLLIQLAPLLAFTAVLFMPVLATESVLVFLSVFLALLIINSFNSKDKGIIVRVIFMAFLTGLIIATKISAFPIVAVPFCFVKGWKNKMAYLAITLFMAFIFILPIYSKLGHFLGFIENIFTHTGKYGGGEKKLFDLGLYVSSLRKIVFEEIPFLIHLFLLVIGCVPVFLKKKIAPELKRMFIGILCATLIGIIIVARHYSFHYLLPVYVLSMPLQMFFWYKLFQDKIEEIQWLKAKWFIAIVIVLVFVRIIVNFHFYPGLKNPVLRTVNEITDKEMGPFIIIKHTSSGTAFIEPALNFGLAYTGSEIRKKYRGILSDLYSKNYLWSKNNGFADWNGYPFVYDLFSELKTLYVYNRLPDWNLAFSEIEEMLEKYRLNKFITAEQVYGNENSGEVIIKLNNDTTKIRSLAEPLETIFVTMEKLSPNGSKFVDESGKWTFNGGEYQSTINSYNGDNSVLLTGTRKYALKTILPVKPGFWITMEAYQKSKSGESAIFVATDEKSKQFYKTSKPLFVQKSNWIKSNFSFQVPEGYTDSTMICYLFLPVADSVWIDDYCIKLFGFN